MPKQLTKSRERPKRIEGTPYMNPNPEVTYVISEENVEKALNITHGMICEAAKLLNCTRQSIWKVMNKYPRLKRIVEELKEATGSLAIDNIAYTIIDPNGDVDPEMKNDNSKWWYANFIKGEYSGDVTINITLDDKLKEAKEKSIELLYGKD